MRKLISFFLLFSLTGCGFFKPLDQKLVSDNDKVRTKAIQKFSDLPPEKKAELIDPLVTHLKNPESRVANRAVDALVLIGAPALEQLKPLLKHEDPFVRANAAFIVGELGPNAGSARPQLTASLSDSHPLVREEAKLALTKIK